MVVTTAWTLCVLCDRTIKFWNLETMRLASSVNGLYSPIRSLAFTVSVVKCRLPSLLWWAQHFRYCGCLEVAYYTALCPGLPR